MRPLTGRLLAVILVSLAVALLATGIAAVTLAGARPLPVAGAVVVLFALACIAIAIPVRRLDRRLEAIATAASSLASGDLSARAPIEAHDELTRLARVLNDLAKRTQATVNDLTAQRDSSDAVLGSLPQGVALVTRDLGITHASARFWELVGVGPPELPSRLSNWCWSPPPGGRPSPARSPFIWTKSGSTRSSWRRSPRGSRPRSGS